MTLTRLNSYEEHVANGLQPGASSTPIIPAGMTIAEFDAQTRVPEVLYGSIIPFGLATIFVLARLYSRLILTRSWGQDDAWISISWVRLLPSASPLPVVCSHYHPRWAP
jgi:hypothetical protein